MSIVHDRGMYNASDDEVKRASGSKIGLAMLKDAGEILINHSYIVVLEGHQARLLHVVDGEEAALAVHVLLRNDEEALIRRQLHAGNLLHLRRDHDEIDLADLPEVAESLQGFLGESLETGKK